jgi:hypothetical protein
MAAFRKRNGKWQVQIRVTGARPISRTFIKKEDAHRWARDTVSVVRVFGTDLPPMSGPGAMRVSGRHDGSLRLAV